MDSRVADDLKALLLLMVDHGAITPDGTATIEDHDAEGIGIRVVLSRDEDQATLRCDLTAVSFRERLEIVLPQDGDHPKLWITSDSESRMEGSDSDWCHLRLYRVLAAEVVEHQTKRKAVAKQWFDQFAESEGAD